MEENDDSVTRLDREVTLICSLEYASFQKHASTDQELPSKTEIYNDTICCTKNGWKN